MWDIGLVTKYKNALNLINFSITLYSINWGGPTSEDNFNGTHPHDLYEMVLEQLIVLCYQQIDQHKIGLTWTKTEMLINNRQHVENHGDIKQKYVELLTLCKYNRIKIW